MKKLDISKPFFYIMLPTFNRPDLVIRSVKSVLSQKYKNYQLFIYNDGSTKDYFELEDLIKNNKNVKYIKGENIGINKSRNHMIDLFLKSKTIENCYFFTLSDDDYLISNALEIMSDEIQKIYSIWYCFNCQTESGHLFKNSNYLNYEKISYANFSKFYKGDKHFVFKLDSFKKIKYPEKYFKNGYEHVFYYQIPSKIQTIPFSVKVIEYYEDGLTLSNIYHDAKRLNVIIKELRSAPYHFIFYKKFIFFFLNPKNFLKEFISDDIYYRIKKRLGLKTNVKKIKNTDT